MFQLKVQQQLPLSIEEAWEFFSSPSNLTLITPPKMRFEIKTQVPPKMYEGLIIQYKVRPLLNIPTKWVTEITHVKEQEYFVDEQRVGPYKMWHHEHFFEKTPHGTMMTDIVSYELPFGWIGRKVLHPIVVKRKVKGIFEFREEKINSLFPQK